MKRFDGVKNIGEVRGGGGSYSGSVSVIDIVITAVEQIQEFDPDPPSVTHSITNLGV